MMMMMKVAVEMVKVGTLGETSRCDGEKRVPGGKTLCLAEDRGKLAA